MQPYFFPYIGYFQLIHAVEEFVVYDQIEYTKRGWINRNRILLNGNVVHITLPLKSDSDHLNINDRFLSASWNRDRRKLINRVTEAYRRAPQFDSVFPLVEKCLLFEETNLFAFLFNALKLTNEYLGISTKLRVSSTIGYEAELKGEAKIISLSKAVGAETYINPIGGRELYSKERFNFHGLDLKFLESRSIEYEQLQSHFVPSLSVIDVMMFNPTEEVRRFLDEFNLV